MATQDVKLPDIGEGVTEGELIKWLVKVGDTVKSDQPVAEVMTDKATVEVPSPYAGVVKELKAKEGAVIPIHGVLLTLDGDAKGAAAAPAKSAAAPSAPAPKAPAAAPAPKAPPPAGASRSPAGSSSGGMDIYPPAADTRVLATPSTRRLAREMNIDINQLSGTGIVGRVTRDDVMSAKGGNGYAAPAAGRATLQMPKGGAIVSGGPDERVPLKGIRRKIAEQMQMTKQIVPHFTLMEEIRVDELVKLRTQAKIVGEQYGVKVTFLPLIMKALIASIREFPMFNASIDDQAQEIVYKKSFNIGFAADTPNGLLVPVVKNADQKTIFQISKEISELSEKARSGKIGLEDMKGATITITNIGSVGGTYATPIINHPEVAILGVYKIQDKPVWENGGWMPAKMQNYTVTCDHRLIDGAVAANFMKHFSTLVENPSRLFLDNM